MFKTHLLSGTGLGDGQGNTKDGVGTKLGLVAGTIELVEEGIDSGLVLDIEVLLNQSGSNDLVDVLDGLGDTLAVPLGLVTISELASLVLAYIIIEFSDCIGGIDECGRDEPVEAPEGTMARWRPVSVTTSTSTVGFPRES